MHPGHLKQKQMTLLNTISWKKQTLFKENKTMSSLYVHVYVHVYHPYKAVNNGLQTAVDSTVL